MEPPISTEAGTAIINLIPSLLQLKYADSFFAYSTTINSYSLTECESGLFAALILLDRPGIVDSTVVARARERLFEALRLQLNSSRAESTDTLHLINELLEVRIPELHSLNSAHETHLRWIKSNWNVVKIALPPLFAEIFDLPKGEDDLY